MKTKGHHFPLGPIAFAVLICFIIWMGTAILASYVVYQLNQEATTTMIGKQIFFVSSAEAPVLPGLIIGPSPQGEEYKDLVVFEDHEEPATFFPSIPKEGTVTPSLYPYWTETLPRDR